MRIGIYPGSFDPVTNGHLDIIERAKGITDKLIIAIAKNSDKTSLFSIDERIEMIQRSCRADDNIDVVAFDGLLVDYCRENGISLIIRGLRTSADFEYENTLASVNRNLAPEIETVLLMSRNDCSFISSRIVREIAGYHGDVSTLIPQFAVQLIQNKFSMK